MFSTWVKIPLCLYPYDNIVDGSSVSILEVEDLKSKLFPLFIKCLAQSNCLRTPLAKWMNNKFMWLMFELFTSTKRLVCIIRRSLICNCIFSDFDLFFFEAKQEFQLIEDYMRFAALHTDDESVNKAERTDSLAHNEMKRWMAPFVSEASST